MMKLVSVGEATADTFPAVNQTLAGGISLNFAVQARRCGADVSLVCAVGRDDNGRLILNKLAREGIDATHVHVVDQPTACCHIEILPGGERYFPPNSYHQNCMAQFMLAEDDLAFIRRHDLAISRYDRAYANTYFEQVMGDRLFTGRRVADFGSWWDYEGDHDRIIPFFPQVAVAFMSGSEATIAALQPAAAAHDVLFVITRGKHGSTALHGQNRLDLPPVRVPPHKVIDTTGAGDAFQAAFVVAYFTHGDIGQALAAGARQAAGAVQHIGAT